MNIEKKKNFTIIAFIKTVLPICIVIIGIAGWNYFKSQNVKIEKKPVKKQITLVETISIKPGNYQSSIRVMGTVMPDKEIILKSNVSGEVTAVSPNFVQGGLLKKGEILLTIDDADYQIDIQKAKSALDKALSDLAIEKGSQLIAKEELKLINAASNIEYGETVKTTDLALRKPQLVKSQSAVESARADFAKAELNMSRTKIIVPFNALVLEQNVNLGSLVTKQGTVATLIAVDTYLIKAQVPQDRLSALNAFKISGDKAIIHSQYLNQTWQGTVLRTTGKITDKSRMVGVIISVPDPLGLKSQKKTMPLLLDAHVNVQIMGKILKNVFSLPRSILRDNNTLWICQFSNLPNNTPDNSPDNPADNLTGILQIKKVELAWKEDDTIFVKSGINANDKIIISDISAPVEGMKLKTMNN